MLTALLAVLVVFAFIYAVLCLATHDKELLPEYIKQRKHDDWIWPLSLLPRRWTSWVLPMPPGKVAGNAEPVWILVQPDYPIAADATRTQPGDPVGDRILSMEPAHPVGQWSVQNVKLFSLLPRVPCYFTGSWKVAGRRLYFNIGLKADVTWDGGTKNWHFGWPEWSLTWLKIS